MALVIAVEAAGDPADVQYEARIIAGLRSFGYEIVHAADKKSHRVRGFQPMQDGIDYDSSEQ